MSEPELNPYAPPTAPLGPDLVASTDGLAEAEAVRRKYLSHEASVKSVGSLHYLSAVFTVLGIVVMIMSLSSGQQFNGAGRGESAVIGFGLYAALTAFHVALGMGLTGLKTWARWVEVVLVSLTLLAFVVAASGALYLSSRGGGMLATMAIVYGFVALIPAYILYLLVSEKGTVVFSPAYRVVIDRTPHIKYKTSCLVWGFLLLVVVFIVIAVVGALSRR
jgi:hypothetical protein